MVSYNEEFLTTKFLIPRSECIRYSTRTDVPQLRYSWATVVVQWCFSGAPVALHLCYSCWGSARLYPYVPLGEGVAELGIVQLADLKHRAET